MSRLSEFFNKIEPVNSDSIKINFDKLFHKFEFNAISVEEVYVDLEGNITVDFTDVDNSYMRVVFAYDDGAYALVSTEGEDVTLFDLDPMRPVLRKTHTGTYIDLTDSTWMTKSFLTALFTAGSDGGYSKPSQIEDDLKQYKVTEASRVIRGGKSIRMPVVHEKKRTNLSQAQKENLVKSLMKRNERALSSSLRLTKE